MQIEISTLLINRVIVASKFSQTQLLLLKLTVYN